MTNTLDEAAVKAGLRKLAVAYKGFIISTEKQALWHSQMNRIGATSDEFNEAIDSHISTSTFEPRIADIANLIRSKRGPF